MENKEAFLLSILNSYQQRSLSDVRLIDLEIAYLKRISKAYAWNQLTDEEKQDSRKRRIELFVKKIYKDDTNQFVDYEVSVVKLYDAIVEALGSLKGIYENDFILTRLYATLFIEKELINDQNQIFKIVHIDKQLIDNLFSVLKTVSIYENLGLSVLESSFQEMYKLLPEKPYRI
ncbi:hypothetical protein [Emticicia fontis]